jgi:hypothetical protein
LSSWPKQNFIERTVFYLFLRLFIFNEYTLSCWWVVYFLVCKSMFDKYWMIGCFFCVLFLVASFSTHKIWRNICVTNDHVVCYVCRNHNPGSFLIHDSSLFTTRVKRLVPHAYPFGTSGFIPVLVGFVSYPFGTSGFIPVLVGFVLLDPLVCCVVFCSLWFFILSVFFWTLCCLAFFHLLLWYLQTFLKVQKKK